MNRPYSLIYLPFVQPGLITRLSVMCSEQGVTLVELNGERGAGWVYNQLLYVPDDSTLIITSLPTTLEEIPQAHELIGVPDLVIVVDEPPVYRGHCEAKHIIRDSYYSFDSELLLVLSTAYSPKANAKTIFDELSKRGLLRRTTRRPTPGYSKRS